MTTTMSTINVVALPRGLDATGGPVCSLVWSPLPANTGTTAAAPDPQAVADWPAVLSSLTVAISVNGVPYAAEVDTAPLRSDLWRALVAALPAPSALAPFLAAFDPEKVITFSTAELYAAAGTLEKEVQQLGVLRADLPFLPSASGATSKDAPVSAKKKTDADTTTVAAPSSAQIDGWAKGALAALNPWWAAFSTAPDAQSKPYQPAPPPPPPTLADVLAAALTMPTLARALGLVVTVRLSDPVSPKGTPRKKVLPPAGSHILRATVTDPSGRLGFRCTAGTPTLLAPSSFTLLTTDPKGKAAGLDRFDLSGAGDYRVVGYDATTTLHKQAHDTTTVPAQTSRGFEFLHHKAADEFILRATRQVARMTELAALSAPLPGPQPTPGPAAPPSAADVESVGEFVSGVRVDVAVVPSGTAPSSAAPSAATPMWRSLMWRRIAVSPRSPAPGPTSFAAFEGDEEGQLSRVQAQKSSFGMLAFDGHQYGVDEHLGAWTGWSLAAPRVGLGVMTGPTENGSLVDPGELPDDLAVRAVLRPPRGVDAPEQALPALRFGRAYRFRLRPVDLAGWSPPPPTDDTAASPAMPHLRRETLAAPVVVLGNIPTEGETAEHLVIRSVAQDPRSDEPADPEKLAERLRDELRYPYAGTSVRHILPPVGSVVTAEQHGAFDEMVGTPEGRRRALRIACKIDGTFSRPAYIDSEIDPAGVDATTTLDRLVLVPRQPALRSEDARAKLQAATATDAETLTNLVVAGTKQTWPSLGAPLQDDLAVAYLGTESLRCPHLPDVAATTLVARLRHHDLEVASAVLHPYAGGVLWPEPRGWRVVLAAGPALKLTPDEGTRTLTVELPAGLSAELWVSAVPSDAMLDSAFYAPAAAGGGLSKTRRAREQAATRQLIIAGLHPRVSDVLKLTLRHAVMRPNLAPRHAPLVLATAVRTRSGGDLRLAGHVLVDRDSTSAVSVSATWSTPPATGPATPGGSHTAQLDRLPTVHRSAHGDIDVDALELGLAPVPLPPVAPRAWERVVAPEDAVFGHGAEVATPLPPDPLQIYGNPGDYFNGWEKALDLYSASRRLPVTGGGVVVDPVAEAMSSIVKAGGVGLVVRGAGGALRATAFDLVPRAGGSRGVTTPSSGHLDVLHDLHSAFVGVSPDAAAGGVAGVGPFVDVPAGVTPMSGTLRGGASRTRTRADAASASRTPTTSARSRDVATTALGQVDLAAVRRQHAVERALGVSNGAFTIADAVAALAAPPTVNKGLLKALDPSAKVAVVFAPTGEERDPTASLQKTWVTEEGIETSVRIDDYWHHLGDTRHVDVDYTPVAHTRYRDCYPVEQRRGGGPSWADALGLGTSWDRAGEVLTSHVVASVAPPAPAITRMIAGEHGTTQVLPGLRIYLGESWFASGLEEKLGIVLREKTPTDLPRPVKVEAEPSQEPPVSDILSIVGTDPAELSAFGANRPKPKRGSLALPGVEAAAPSSVASAPPRTSTGDVRYLIRKDFIDGDDVDDGWVGPADAVTYERAVYPLLAPNGDALPPADILAIPVHWSKERRQHYADLRFAASMSGVFVRLSLVRYQPWALITPAVGDEPALDLRYSALLSAEFVWVNGAIMPRVSPPPRGR